MSYFIGILMTLVIYGIIIRKVDSGRCFRYEFMVKTLVIYGLYMVCFIAIVIGRTSFSLISVAVYYFSLLMVLATPVLMFLSLKYTIQRFYDLDMDGWYVLLKLIPVFSIAVTVYLYLKKGARGINDYDKAIDYIKYFKNQHFISIYDKMLVIDNEEYQYERYLDKYTIKVSKYAKESVVTGYLRDNYHMEEGPLYQTAEITKEQFKSMIESLGLVIIYDSFYIGINGYKVFIRKEDFKYTIILDKSVNEVSQELADVLNFPGSFYEDEGYMYYHKIDREQLLRWYEKL